MAATFVEYMSSTAHTVQNELKRVRGVIARATLEALCAAAESGQFESIGITATNYAGIFTTEYNLLRLFATTLTALAHPVSQEDIERTLRELQETLPMVLIKAGLKDDQALLGRNMISAILRSTLTKVCKLKERATGSQRKRRLTMNMKHGTDIKRAKMQCDHRASGWSISTGDSTESYEEPSSIEQHEDESSDIADQSTDQQMHAMMDDYNHTDNRKRVSPSPSRNVHHNNRNRMSPSPSKNVRHTKHARNRSQRGQNSSSNSNFADSQLTSSSDGSGISISLAQSNRGGNLSRTHWVNEPRLDLWQSKSKIKTDPVGKPFLYILWNTITHHLQYMATGVVMMEHGIDDMRLMIEPRLVFGIPLPLLRRLSQIDCQPEKKKPMDCGMFLNRECEDVYEYLDALYDATAVPRPPISQHEQRHDVLGLIARMCEISRTATRQSVDPAHCMDGLGQLIFGEEQQKRMLQNMLCTVIVAERERDSGKSETERRKRVQHILDKDAEQICIIKVGWQCNDRAHAEHDCALRICGGLMREWEKKPQPQKLVTHIDTKHTQNGYRMHGEEDLKESGEMMKHMLSTIMPSTERYTV